MFKKILSTLFILFSFISCKYDLLPAPSSNGNSNAPQFNNKKILPPQNVIASQGDYRSVTLSWDPVKNATQYLIFSADTEFDTFEKVGETKGSATTFTVQEPTGSTKAYYIKSVDYYGNSSRPSFIAIGSTISVPIITDITKNKEGDIYTLNWWMSNCSESTYEDLISYTINVYEEGINTPTKIEIPGNLTSYNLTSLKQSTVYKFTIEAFKTGTKQKHEISDAEPIETGHRIVPDAVKELTVSKGISTTDINISFKLPSTIESSTGDGTYEKDNPLYFTLKRKLEDEDDSAFTTIYEYVGFNENSKYAKNISAEKKIILSGSYTEDQLVELTNKLETADRGKKFVYQIQSYTDVKGDIENANISSAITSVASETGWTIAQASFRLEASNIIEKDENNPEVEKITKISVTFHTSFDNLDQNYSYYLTTLKYALKGDNQDTPLVVNGKTENLIKKANNIFELNDYTISYDNPDEQQGYYAYKLYITKESDISEVPTNPADIIEEISSPSKITVTSDANALPVIKNGDDETFYVDDGYSNKFILTWDVIEGDCEYILSWRNKNGDGYTDSKSIGPFTAENYSEPNESGTTISEIKTEGGKITLTHTAEPGEIRSYTLTAIKGLSNSCEKKEDFYALGKAAPEMQTPDYDTITIVWDKVQRAKTDITEAYKVSAKYADGSTELITTDNCSITEENSKIKCVITQPSGYDDASISGKTINFEVTTIGDKDETTSNSQVYNLGPANLNVTRDPDLYTDHINISWNRIEGANGYLVFRTIKDISGNYISEGNALFVNQDGVYYDGSKISSVESQFTGEKVSFTDCYEYTNRDDAQTDALKRDQIQLTWGLPFSYTVVPVLSDKDIRFEISDSQIKAETTKKDHTFTYENMSETISSTFGYGLNVNASKAASNTTVTVTWEQPYNPANKIPRVYRRGNKSDDWDKVANPTQSNEKTMSVDITYGPNDTNTYEYAVVYNNSEFDETYLEKLASDFDTENSPKELKCKGYTLSLPQGFITASHGTGYQEIFDWTDSTYDFNNRNIGPDYYEIQILNKNKATGWTAIGKISVDQNNNNYGKQVTSDYKETTLVTAKSNSNYQAIIEPVFDSDNISFGQLKVLRDYKHYYRLVAVKMIDDKRENAIVAIADKHKLTDTSLQNPYEDVFAIRDITDEELIKCINLIIGDALYKRAIPYKTVTGSATDTLEGAVYEGNKKGTFTISSSPVSAFDYKNRVTWAFDNYKPIFNNGTSGLFTSETVSGFTLSSSTSEKKNGSDEHKLYYLPPLKISLNHESNLPSYQKEFIYEIGKEGWSIVYNIKVTDTSNKVIINKQNLSDTEFYKWFPFELGKKIENGSSDKNQSFKTYQSPWWDTSSQGGN